MVTVGGGSKKLYLFIIIISASKRVVIHFTIHLCRISIQTVKVCLSNLGGFGEGTC